MKIKKSPSKRMARCHCMKTMESDKAREKYTENGVVRTDLFSERPEKPYDSFYCGCSGWD